MSGSTRADAEQPSAGAPSSRPRSRTTEVRPLAPLRVLLSSLIDYAGLFPPAALTMREAVARYAEHRRSSDAWMLGRFVVPVARLDELARALAGAENHAGSPWRVSAIGGGDSRHDAKIIERFNSANPSPAVVDMVEVRVSSPATVGATVEPFAPSLVVFAEIALDDLLERMLSALASTRARAKVRAGGITADVFPSSQQLAQFLVACAAHSLPFKATAGLHHPLRAEYSLTYETGSSRATMFGFVNVFLAAAIANAGVPVADIEALLEERDPAAIRVSDSGIGWRAYQLSTEQLTRLRDCFALSFGSCSFSEPLEGLRTLAFL